MLKGEGLLKRAEKSIYEIILIYIENNICATATQMVILKDR